MKSNRKNFQMTHKYTFDSGRGGDGIHTEKSSFLTIENAIKNAWFWINKEESWIDTTVVSIVISNKTTGEILWSYGIDFGEEELNTLL